MEYESLDINYCYTQTLSDKKGVLALNVLKRWRSIRNDEGVYVTTIVIDTSMNFLHTMKMKDPVVIGQGIDKEK